MSGVREAERFLTRIVFGRDANDNMLSTSGVEHGVPLICATG